MIMNTELVRNLVEEVVAYFKLLYQYVPRRTHVNHKEFSTVYSLDQTPASRLYARRITAWEILCTALLKWNSILKEELFTHKTSLFGNPYVHLHLVFSNIIPHVWHNDRAWMTVESGVPTVCMPRGRFWVFLNCHKPPLNFMSIVKKRDSSVTRQEWSTANQNLQNHEEYFYVTWLFRSVHYPARREGSALLGYCRGR